jgi:hypothetical protein
MRKDTPIGHEHAAAEKVTSSISDEVVANDASLAGW